MMALTDPSIEELVLMTSSQVGKTEIELNFIGYHIHHDPAPMLIVYPTVEMGEAFSKDRLKPMLRDSPALRDKVSDAARVSEDTIRHKLFPGGHLTISGANSPSSLASRPVRFVVMDEVDRFPPSAGNEGDPVRLAKKRANNFWNKKFIQVSTPTLKGLSRIEHSFSLSDQRHFCVPCAKCGKREAWDQWKLVVWDKDRNGRHLPKTAGIECPKCGHRHTEVERQRQIRVASELPDFGWVARADARGIAGFHLNELISPWRDMASITQDFLDMKGSQEQLKTFVNTVLGETFEVAGDSSDPALIAQRREPYEKAPGNVLVLVAGGDVQDDRIELEVIGFGEGNENWGIEVQTFIGNPGLPQLWERVDEYLQKQFELADGRKLPIAAACIDSGGHYTQDVYRFCSARFTRGIYAIKGRAGQGIPIAGKLTRNTKGRAPLLIVGVDAAKERWLLNWLRLTKTNKDGPTPGYCHFPANYSDEFFEQLTAESVKTVYHKGFPSREWVQTRRRNEALDRRNYALAALETLAPNYAILRQRLTTTPSGLEPEGAQAKGAWIDQSGDWMQGGSMGGDRPF